jgi:hypothetical protein
MSVTYPITLPTSPGFTRVTIAPRSFVALYASPFTGQQQIYQHPAQFLTCSIEVPPMNRAEAADFVAAMLSLQGQRGTFYFGDPAWTSPRGVATGTPQVNGDNQTGTALNTKGWTTGVTNILRAGDWIQIGTGATRQLCMVLESANSNGSGHATVNLFPRIRTAFANNTAITTASPTGVWRMVDDGQFLQDTDGLTRGMNINAVEAF